MFTLHLLCSREGLWGRVRLIVEVSQGLIITASLMIWYQHLLLHLHVLTDMSSES